MLSTGPLPFPPSSPSSSSVPMKPAHEIIGGLKEAKTLRDIYRLPMPVSSPLVCRNEAINNFQTDANNGVLSLTINTDERGEELWPKQAIDPDLREVMEAVGDLDAISGFDDARKRIQFEFRSPYTKIMSPVICAPHVDGATMPRLRLYFYASSSPTYVVSHDNTLALFNLYAPRVLDTEFADPKFYREFSDARENLREKFSRAATPIRVQELSVMSGATIHFMPGNTDPTRRFMRARIFDPSSK
ncbi:MAG: hypothetical protein DI586_05405 [Micavibrio aeruginosavorus]|uniref:Uncharacterized protein n=1 Tax=Micavibrio aeruginosavorus TaxID=349221 RepID=A0A2W5FL46_9BACT|nr:MAG: hypothetical protein DI586_05405 [Micavibrio aeruginosavorus]